MKMITAQMTNRQIKTTLVLKNAIRRDDVIHNNIDEFLLIHVFITEYSFEAELKVFLEKKNLFLGS